VRRRGIACTIPQPADQIRNRKNKGRTDGRPPAFDQEIYKQRHAGSAASTDSNATEQPRQDTTVRMIKVAVCYEAILVIALINEWLYI
jgi:hypothetical protein